MSLLIGNKIQARVNKIQETRCYCTFLPIGTNQFGFMPNKLMPSFFDKEGKLNKKVGDIVDVIIYNITDRGIIISDIQSYEKRQNYLLVSDFVSKYEEGSVFEAEVTKVENSRVIIKLGGYQGVVRKQDINWNEINKLGDLLFEGETISVAFIGHDAEHLYFSLKLLSEKPYDESLYDLSLEDLLKYIGHESNVFVGQAKRYNFGIFIENLYSLNNKQRGKLLIDPIYGYNLRAIVANADDTIKENMFYSVSLGLVPQNKRKERNQLFQFIATNIAETTNPYKKDVKVAFQRNTTNPTGNQRDARLLEEIGNNMYSSKERMFFELVQNADDAASQSGVLINVKTRGDYLIVKHNGYSFDRDDFISITTAANGTKKANENKTGYKGIGFKSVFTDSEQVFINTGGYRFKFDKNHSIFQDFDKFYLENNPMIISEEAKNRFLALYNDCKVQFDGIRSIPWQLEPIWTNAFPIEVGDDFTSYNVSIALRLGNNKIEGEYGYYNAINEIIRNPKFMLFLRKTKRIDFNGKSVSKITKNGVITLKNSFNSERVEYYKQEDFEIPVNNTVFEKHGIDIRIEIDNYDEVSGKILEAKFVDLDKKVFENIPPKIAINNSTYISFAVPITEDGKLNPRKQRDEISMFAFLPTLVKDFKFPFFINANFILDPPRQRILGDNPWNLYLMQEIAKCLVRWCATLNIKRDKNALNVLVSEYFSEEISDTKLLAKYFNESYKTALKNEPLVLNHRGTLSRLDEIAIDKPGLSNLVGPDVFCQLMQTQRALPSPSIDSSILKEKIFNDVKCFEIDDVLKAITNSQIFNNWFISASDKQKTIFYAWIKWIYEKTHEQHSACLLNLVSYLPLYHFESEYKSYNDIAGSNYVVTSKHIIPIKNILNKLGFKCSENTIDDSHPLLSLMQFQDEEILWQSILNCDYSTLCFEERLALFLALRDFNGVGEAKLKEIALFKNKKGEFKPLGEMAISEKSSPSWLEQFLISANEASPSLLKYLIKEENILSQIVQPKYELFANVSILELYSYFNEYWTLTLTKSLIDRCGTTEELLSIAEITDGAKHYLIEKHGKISLDSSLSKGSVEYRLIKLAIKSAINIDYLKSIIFIDNKNLSQYTISDDVLFNISGKEYHFSLSKILPNRFEYNVFNEVKEILSDIDGYDKLFTLSRMPNKTIKDKLTEIRSSRTPEQYAFFICYNIANNQRYNISITDTEFVTNVLSYFFEHQIYILDKYINCFINQKVVGKFINADEVTIESERLSSTLRTWADNEEKEKFLIHLGAKGPLSDEIKRRKSFINNDPISLSYSGNILSEIVAFLDWAVTLHTPFYKINQVNILKEMFTRLKYFTKIDIEDYRKAKEWDNGRYIELVKNKIRIFLMNEEMPKRGIYKNVHLFTEYTGDYEYISQSGIYVNIKDKPIETVLLTVSDDSAVPFQKDDWAKLFMVSIEKLTEKENEILQKNKKIESLAESIQERDEIIRRYRAKYGDLEHDDNRIEHNNDINNETYSTTAIGPAEIIKRDVLSHDEQITAHREAEQIVRRMLESDGYNCTNWRSIESSKDNIFQEWKSVNQVRDIVTPYGENINLVIKSAKGGYIYLSATDFEFLTSNSNNVLMVWDGNTVHSVTAEDIFNRDSNVNLIFDTEYTPKHYYAALSKVFQYIKRTTFAVKNPKYNASETIKSFGMDAKTEGVQELFDDNDL